LAGCTTPPGRTSQASSEPITEQQAYDIAYAVIAKELGYQPPGREEWRYWGIRQSQENGRSVWVVGADFAPAGGGDHAYAVIDARTGEVVRAKAGRHLR
jgi:hypothetical protein